MTHLFRFIDELNGNEKREDLCVLLISILAVFQQMNVQESH